MTPEGSGHPQLPIATTHFQSNQNQLHSVGGHFQPVACQIQPNAGQLQQINTGQLQYTTNQFQHNVSQLQPVAGQFQPVAGQLQLATGQLQPTFTQLPFIQTSPLSNAGSSYVYQLVGSPQSLIAGQSLQQATPTVANTPQYSLIGFQSVYPLGTSAISPSLVGQPGQGAALPHIKSEHGPMQIAFNPTTNQLQAFPQHQLLSLHPQQQLQFQPQQLLCSPPIFTAAPNQSAIAQQPVRQKKASRKPSRKKAGDSLKQPAGSGETVMQETKRLPSGHEHLATGLDIVFVVGEDPEESVTGCCFDGLSESDFWRLLLAAGLVDDCDGTLSTPSPTVINGPRLLKAGLGLTTVIAADSGGLKRVAAADVTSLRAKLLRYKPKVVVFHGKTLFEAIFSSSEKKALTVTYYGQQPPQQLEVTAVVQWVLPAGSDRSAGWPLCDLDKLVPCYRALKKYRDNLNGVGPRPSEAECTFYLASLAARARKVRKEEFILRKEDRKKDAQKSSGSRREEAPSTSVQSVQQVGTFLCDSAVGCSDSEMQF